MADEKTPAVEQVNWTQQMRATRTDGASGGECALGVRYMMQRLGWWREGMQGHGKDWLNFDKWDNRRGDEWVRVSVHPDDAPVGSIVAWDGGGGANTAGRTFGHVEMKGLDGQGDVKWYSDAARDTWGGTRRHHVGDHDRFAVFVRRDQLSAEELAAIENNPASNRDRDGTYKHASLFRGREQERQREGGDVRPELEERWRTDPADVTAPAQASFDEFQAIFAVAAIGFLAKMFGVSMPQGQMDIGNLPWNNVPEIRDPFNAGGLNLNGAETPAPVQPPQPRVETDAENQTVTPAPNPQR